MKKNHSLLIFAFTGLLLSCGGGQAVTADIVATFHTGYDAFAIESQAVKNGHVSKPSASKEGYTVYGYYADPSFQTEFDFSKAVSSSVDVYAKVLKGDGSDASPYEVGSALSLTSLTHLGSEIKGKAIVTNDFATNSESTEDYRATSLSGVFDGQGHTITIDLETEGSVHNTGLFSSVAETGVIKNVNLYGAISGAQASTGGITNVNYGTMENCFTCGTTYHASNGCNNGVSLMTKFDEDDSTLVTEDFGTVGELDTLSKGGAGAICGTNRGVIKDCYNKMMVQATIGAGGIAGINYGAIENCFNCGAVGTTGNYSVNSTTIRDHQYDFSYIGGIAGANFGTVTQSVNANQVFVARLPWLYNDAPAGQSDYCGRIRVGGIVGYNAGTYDEASSSYTGGIVTECSNYGRVHGDMQVGGIAGYSSGYISDCFFSGFIGGRSCVGTIAGWQSGDKTGDKPGVVQRSIGISRIVAGSFPSPMLDEDDNTYEGASLTDTSSGKTSNVNEYYKIAKYASQCVYHNYSGNINPIDPSVDPDEEDTNTSTNTTATMTASAYNQVGKVDGAETGKWFYEDSSSCTAIVGINTSWQVYLNVRPAWQSKTVTYVVDGVSKSFQAVAGVNYIDNILYPNSEKYVSSLKSNPSGAISSRGLPMRNPIEVPTGCVLKWVTVDGDASTVWDGLVRDDITLYPMAIPA